MQKRIEIDKNSVCPCGSGEQYKSCCALQNFKWTINEKGDLFQEFQLTEKTKEIFENQEAAFKRHFGRKMRPDEPIFFQTHAFHSPEAFELYSETIFDRMEPDPAIKYANKNLGGFVTETNFDTLTGKQKEEWLKYINEYHTQPQFNEDIPKELKISGELCEEFFTLIFLISNILYKKCKFPKSNRSVPQTERFKTTFILFCFAKTLNHLKSINYLLNSYQGEDALILIRSIFENYLSSIYTIANPESMYDTVMARKGLKNGTYSYKLNKKGKPIYSIAIEKSSGREVPIPISFYQMAKTSPFPSDVLLYETLYPILSGFTHPDLIMKSIYINMNAVNPYHDELYLEVPLNAVFFTMLLVDSFYSLNIATKVIQKDIKRVLKRISRKYMALYKEFSSQGANTNTNIIWNERLDSLAVLSRG
jgi:uncharacterized protein DUF5677/SEC-C motif-containing protein